MGLQLLNILFYYNNEVMILEIKYKDKSWGDLMIFTMFYYILLATIRINAR